MFKVQNTKGKLVARYNDLQEARDSLVGTSNYIQYTKRALKLLNAGKLVV